MLHLPTTLEGGIHGKDVLVGGVHGGHEDSGSKLLVASKIADKEGLTRSVIVNSIRKMETASILVSKSLGMKGTILKLTNRNAVQKFFELAKNKVV